MTPLMAGLATLGLITACHKDDDNEQEFEPDLPEEAADMQSETGQHFAGKPEKGPIPDTAFLPEH
jgi:hypothetical protein